MDDLFQIIIPNQRIKGDCLSANASWSVADEYRMRLFNATCYLTLLMGLAKNGISNAIGKQNLNDLKDLVNEASDQEIAHLGPQTVVTVCSVIEKLEDTLPPIISRGQIASDFNELCKSGDFDWSTGIEFGWLAQRFNCDRLGILDGFPLHGKVGVGHHAGHLITQEQLLLHDSYLTRSLVLRNAETVDLSRNSSLSIEEQDTKYLREASAGLCRDARFCITSLFSLVECLLNSVSENHIRDNPSLREKDIEFLRGKKKGRWVTFVQRLEGTPGVVNGSYKNNNNATDPKQRSKDINYLISTIKPLRDSAAHYSINKASIWYGPLDWAKTVDKSGRVVINVLKSFWSACYPHQGLPEYLYDLNLTAIEKECELWSNEEKIGWKLLQKRRESNASN